MLSRSLEPEIFSFYFVSFFTRLEAIHRIIGSGLDHVGREDGSEWLIRDCETVFGDHLVEDSRIPECVHHPLDEGELELHEVTLQVCETRSCHIRGTFLIDPASDLGDLRMIPDWEVELSNSAPLFHDDILLFGESDRGIGCWDIWDFLVEREEFSFYFLKFWFEGLDFFFDGFRFFENMRLRFSFPHARREIITSGPESIELLPERHASEVETDHFIEIDSFGHFIVNRFSDEFGIGTENFDIDHY